MAPEDDLRVTPYTAPGAMTDKELRAAYRQTPLAMPTHAYLREELLRRDAARAARWALCSFIVGLVALVITIGGFVVGIIALLK